MKKLRTLGVAYGGLSWNDLTLEEWVAWVADATVLRLAFYLQTTYYNEGVTLYCVYFNFTEPDYRTLLTCGYKGGYGMGAAAQLGIKRLSETRLQVTNNAGVDAIELTLAVYGEAA